MRKITALAMTVATLVGLAFLWNTLGAEALPTADHMPSTPIVNDGTSAEMEHGFGPSVSRSLYPRFVDTLSESRLNELAGAVSESPHTFSLVAPTNTPGAPGAAPMNTPAAPRAVLMNTPAPPVSRAGPTLERVSPVLTAPNLGDRAASTAPPQQLTPLVHVNDDQDLAQTELLRQAVGRIDVPNQRLWMRQNLLPQSATEVVYADVLLNPELNVVEFGDGTGSIEYWSILFQKVCYSRDDGDPPDYSLVMNDGTCSVNEDTDLVDIEGETWDYDQFGQGFMMPPTPTAIRVSLSSVCANVNATDEARWWLYTLTSEGYLDEWKVSAEIPDNTDAFRAWFWELTAADYPDLFADIAGRPMAIVYTVLGDLAEPSEVVWLDDLQVRIWYERGPAGVYLPVVQKLRPNPSGPTCKPREPDSLTSPGSTAVDATCGGSFNAVDQQDYYMIDLNGVDEVRLRLFNLPEGTNWDAMIYENASGYPLACHIGTPGDGNKSVDCNLNPSRNYFVLVSRGPNRTGGTYQMQLVDISDPDPMPTPSPSPTPTPSPTPSGPQWQTIVNETFEGAFPGAWDVFDGNGGDYGEYYWKKSSCREYAGSYSGWSIGAGAQGGGLGCGANYPNGAMSWMIYGPFSLADATAADLSFKLWINSENDYDFLCRYASTNGTDFSGTCTHGNSSGWIDRGLDLTDVYSLGDLTGESNVWIAFLFRSDGSVTYSEGAFVDNVVLRKCTSAACAAAELAPQEAGGELLHEWPAQDTLATD